MRLLDDLFFLVFLVTFWTVAGHLGNSDPRRRRIGTRGVCFYVRDGTPLHLITFIYIHVICWGVGMGYFDPEKV